MQNLGFGDTGVSLSTAVMTIVILIFGEISPKSIAKETPEKFAMAVAGAIFHTDAVNADQLSVQPVEEAAFDDV